MCDGLAGRSRAYPVQHGFEGAESGRVVASRERPAVPRPPVSTRGAQRHAPDRQLGRHRTSPSRHRQQQRVFRFQQTVTRARRGTVATKQTTNRKALPGNLYHSDSVLDRRCALDAEGSDAEASLPSGPTLPTSQPTVELCPCAAESTAEISEYSPTIGTQYLICAKFRAISANVPMNCKQFAKFRTPLICKFREYSSQFAQIT
jgi:hypothetical protein